MSLDVLGEINKQVRAPGAKCLVRQALDQLEPDVRAGYAAALALPTAQAPHAAISRALAARGVSLSHNSITRHRNEGCRCLDDDAE